MVLRFLLLITIGAVVWASDIAGFTYFARMASRKSDTAVFGVVGIASVVIANIFIAYYWLRAFVRLWTADNQEGTKK